MEENKKWVRESCREETERMAEEILAGTAKGILIAMQFRKGEGDEVEVLTSLVDKNSGIVSPLQIFKELVDIASFLNKKVSLQNEGGDDEVES